MSLAILFLVCDPKILPPDVETILVHDGRCVGCVEHGAHHRPHVALEDKALPPVLELDHDVVVREGDKPNSDGAYGHQCGKQGPSEQSQGKVKELPVTDVSTLLKSKLKSYRHSFLLLVPPLISGRLHSFCIFKRSVFDYETNTKPSNKDFQRSVFVRWLRVSLMGPVRLRELVVVRGLEPITTLHNKGLIGPQDLCCGE